MRKKDIDMQLLPTNTISDLNVADLNYCRGRWTPVWVPYHGTVRGGAPSPTWPSTAAFMSRRGAGAGTPWRNKYCLNVSVNLESCLFKENSGMSVFLADRQDDSHQGSQWSDRSVRSGGKQPARVRLQEVSSNPSPSLGSSVLFPECCSRYFYFQALSNINTIP